MEQKKEVNESGRLVSLDALRGFDMFWIVGAGGLADALDKLSGQPVMHFIATQLEHKQWEGFAFNDLIFPLFVFMAGVSIVFSLPKYIERQGKWAAHVRLLRRFILLFALGIFYYGGFSHEWPAIRLMGVLQRIALAYFFASLLFCNLKLRGLIVACAVILIGYWACLTFIPVPELGHPSFSQEHNLPASVDKALLPGLKLFPKQTLTNKPEDGEPAEPKVNGTWDPEGILSTFPAVASCLFGVFAGMVLASPTLSKHKKWLGLIGAGIVGVALGFLWGYQFPVIKKIWTSSYVLVAGGYSAILLGVFYLVVDVLHFRTWCRPFLWIGTNALTIYLACNIVKFEHLAERFTGGNVERALGNYGELVTGIFSLGLVMLLARFLYRNKIFLRV